MEMPKILAVDGKGPECKMLSISLSKFEIEIHIGDSG